MANRYVRIHNKPEGFGEPASMIGFSMSAVPAREDLPYYAGYFTAHGQSVRAVSHAKDNENDIAVLEELGGVSPYYLEIKPPLQEGQLAHLGRLCSALVDPSHNTGYLIDNRETELPLRPFDTRGEVVASW